MSKVILEAVVAYIATNIDDIFVLMFLCASSNKRSDFGKIILGKYIGIYIIAGISFLAAFGLTFIPESYIRFLGIVPILLGIKAYLDSRKKDGSEETLQKQTSSLILYTALITVANSADNIGVYIPLFANYSLWQMLMTGIVFAVMTLLWCLLGEKIASLPLIKNTIQAYKHIAVPVSYMLLGLYILIF